MYKTKIDELQNIVKEQKAKKETLFKTKKRSFEKIASIQDNIELNTKLEDKTSIEFWNKQLEAAEREQKNATNELLNLESELLLNEKELDEFLDMEREAKNLDLKKEKQTKSLKGEKIAKKFSYNIQQEGKSVKRTFEYSGVENEIEGYDPLEETGLFLKAMKDQNFGELDAYQKRYAKALKYQAYNQIQDTAVTDATEYEAPGYHLEAGESVNAESRVPRILTDIVMSNLYSSSHFMWLAGGITTRVNREMVILLEEMTGADWRAEGEEFPELDIADFSISVNFKKIAGIFNYSDESIKFGKITPKILSQMSVLFARMLAKKLDFDILNGKGGKDQIVGLTSVLRDSTKPNAAGDMLLAPTTEYASNYPDIINRIIETIDYDYVDAFGTPRVLISQDIAEKCFVFGPTTGGADQMVATDLGGGNFTYRGVIFRKARNLFRYNDKKVVAVVNYGGLEIASDNPSAGVTFLTDPYTNAHRGLTRLTGYTFYDCVVQNSSKVILVVDTFTPMVNSVTTHTDASLAVVLKNALGEFIPAETKVRAYIMSGSGSTARLTFAGEGKVAGAAGVATIALTGAKATDTILLRTSNNMDIAVVKPANP